MKTLFKNLIFWMICICFKFLQKTHSQQTYINNEQFNCDQNDTSTSGYLYLCSKSLQTSCQSYLTIRAQPPYDSAADIGFLLNSDPSMIAELNNITAVQNIPTDNLIIVPITNCSCSGNYFQYNSTYRLTDTGDTYFRIANHTYQGLTTCQALINQNPQYGVRDLVVPLRCACPSRNQTSNGVKYLLSYLVTWGDTITSISDSFGVELQSVLDANQLSFSDLIFPFTPLLIPLKTQPTYNPNAKPPPAAKPPTISIPTGDNSNSNNSSSSSSKTWVFVGIGIGLFLLVIVLLGFWFLRCQGWDRVSSFLRRRNNQTTHQRNSQSLAVSSKNVRILINSSFNVHTFEELKTATNQFSEDNRIKASVYRGVIKGDNNAAIKRMKRNSLNEVRILKQTCHSSVVRLTGYCMHEVDTYLVYEYMENGSLSDWLPEDKTFENPVARLGWKQRVQIAYDVADGLNYLHNYVNPAYVHKDLKSSNILLDGNFRAKIANFGLARKVNDKKGGEDEGLQLTRHVVGTLGYLAPEYIENGVVTSKLDVFAFGVVMLELLSGKEATVFFNSIGNNGKTVKGEVLLFVSINQVLDGENVREKLQNFIDPSLASEYPLELALSMADLAKSCVAYDLNSRPNMLDVFASLSKILSSSLHGDP